MSGDYLKALHDVAEARRKMADAILQTDDPVQKQPLQKFVNLFNLLVTGIEQQIDLDLSAMNVKPACKEGCHWCCCVKISCTPIEAMFAALWILQRCPDLIDSVVTFDNQTQQVGVDRRWRKGAWCPFLVQKNQRRVCGIYLARPMPCRAYLSLKANDCRIAARQLNRGNNDNRVPYLNHLLHANSSMMAGISEACNKAGLDCEPVEFVGAVRIALKTKDVVKRWLAGERLFDAARAPEINMRNISRTLQEVQLYGNLVEAMGQNSSATVQTISPIKAANIIRQTKP